MKRFFVLIMVGSFLLSACSPATGIDVSNAWARPAVQGGNGAVYFLIQNNSAGADELTGVSSDIADAIEMHESKMEGDVMQMRQVMSVEIPGKASIEFAPGGLHVMLIGLKQELKVGNKLQVTLHFEDHEDITVTVPVQEAGTGDSADDH